MKSNYEKYAHDFGLILITLLFITCCVMVIDMIVDESAEEAKKEKERLAKYEFVVSHKWNIAMSDTFCRYEIDVSGFLSHKDHREPVNEHITAIQRCDAFNKGDVFKFKLE